MQGSLLIELVFHEIKILLDYYTWKFIDVRDTKFPTIRLLCTELCIDTIASALFI